MGDSRFDGNIERSRVWMLPGRGIFRLHLLQHFERCSPFSSDSAAAVEKGENRKSGQRTSRSNEKSRYRLILAPAGKNVVIVMESCEPWNMSENPATRRKKIVLRALGGYLHIEVLHTHRYVTHDRNRCRQDSRLTWNALRARRVF